MNKRLMSVVLIAVLAVALVFGAVVVTAADVDDIDQFNKLCERGGTIKLGANFTHAKGNSVDHKIERDLTIDLNGYDLEGTLTVAAGKTLTIKDTDEIGTFDGDIYLVSAKSTVKVESGSISGNIYVNDDEAKAEINGGTFSELNIVDDEKGTINVNGGSPVKEDETAIVIESNGAVNVKGSRVSELTLNEKAVATVTGGTIDTVTVTENAKLTLDDKSTGVVIDADVEGEINVYGGQIGQVKSDGSIAGEITGSGNVYVDSANAGSGVLIAKIGDSVSVKVENGYVSAKVDEDELKEYFPSRKYAYASYTNYYVETVGKQNTLKSVTYWVVGSDLISDLELDSYVKYKNTNDKGEAVGDEQTKADELAIKANTESTINVNVKTGCPNVMVTLPVAADKTADFYKTNKDVKVNGYRLGDAAMPINQPIHEWAAEVTAKTDATSADYCQKTSVLRPYYEDLNKNELNGAPCYGIPGEDGKVTGLYNTEKDFKGTSVVRPAGHTIDIFHSYVPATSTTPGSIAYAECSVCHMLFNVEVNFANFGNKSGADLVKAQEAYKLTSSAEIKPVETTAAPEETTKAPAETTKAPAETTKAPEETTKAPADTQKPDDGNKPNVPKTGDVAMNNLVWVIVIGVSVLGVAVAGTSVVASKKH